MYLIEPQLQILADILLIGLLESLEEKEGSLTLPQLHTRQFTPHQQLTRNCVYFLFKKGRVNLSFNQIPRTVRKRETRTLIISLPAKMRNYGRTNFLLSKQVKSRLYDFDCGSLIESLDLEIQAYECVEYIRFYLEREGLILKEEQGSPERIKLLLLELHQKQVCMLLWRSVKTCSEFARERKLNSISVSDICATAYKYFIAYRKREILIDHYNIPIFVSNSSIRETLLRLSPHHFDDKS